MDTRNNFDGMEGQEYWLDHLSVGKRATHWTRSKSGSTQVPRLVRNTEELESTC